MDRPITMQRLGRSVLGQEVCEEIDALAGSRRLDLRAAAVAWGLPGEFYDELVDCHEAAKARWLPVDRVARARGLAERFDALLASRPRAVGSERD